MTPQLGGGWQEGHNLGQVEEERPQGELVELERREQCLRMLQRSPSKLAIAPVANRNGMRSLSKERLEDGRDKRKSRQIRRSRQRTRRRRRTKRSRL